MIGRSKEVVKKYYLRYKAHGLSAFKSSNKEHSYGKEFKLSII